MLGGLSVPLFLLKTTCPPCLWAPPHPPQLWTPHCPTLAKCPACAPPDTHTHTHTHTHTLPHTLPAVHLAAPPSSGPSLGVSTSRCPQLGHLLKVPVLQWGGGQPPPQLFIFMVGASVAGTHCQGHVRLNGVGKVQEGPGDQGAGTPHNSQSPQWVLGPEAQKASRTWGLFSELRQPLQPEVGALSHPWVCLGPAHVLLAETRP